MQPDEASTKGHRCITNGTPSHLNLPPRNNRATTFNRNGQDLSQLCRSLILYNVNGRIRGRRSLGGYTCIDNPWQQPCKWHDHRHRPILFQHVDSQAPNPLIRPDKWLHSPTRQTAHMPDRLISILRPYRWAQVRPAEYQEAMNS